MWRKGEANFSSSLVYIILTLLRKVSTSMDYSCRKFFLLCPVCQRGGNCIEHPSSLHRTICICYEGKTIGSDRGMNANFIYEAVHFRLLFASSLLWGAQGNYADSPITCSMMLTEYISNAVDYNFLATTCVDCNSCASTMHDVKEKWLLLHNKGWHQELRNEEKKMHFWLEDN